MQLSQLVFEVSTGSRVPLGDDAAHCQPCPEETEPKIHSTMSLIHLEMRLMVECILGFVSPYQSSVPENVITRAFKIALGLGLVYCVYSQLSL